MSNRVRWGILGTGKIARILAQAIAGSRTAKLMAVGSRDVDRARDFATEFSVPRHGHYSAVVDDAYVDLVYVATNHPTHSEWAIRAAEAEKHVLCEKPLAVTLGDATTMVDAARRNGVFMMEAFAYRCHPQTQRLVEVLDAGAIGKIRIIDAVFGYNAGHRPANYLFVHELAGGSILDVGCYTTSMSHLLAKVAAGGRIVEPVTVTGAAHIGASTRVDHTAAATLAFEGGLVARVASSIEADMHSVLRVYGSEGSIGVASPWLPGWTGRDAEIVIERPGRGPEVLPVDQEADVYAIEVDAVGSLVRSGELSPSMMPWEESLANMRTLDRWRRAIGLVYDQDRRGAEASTRHGTPVTG